MRVKKLNKYSTVRSECAMRPVLHKLRSNKPREGKTKADQDETSKLSRVTSLLPSISSTHSFHFKTGNISSFNTGMMIVGCSLVRKKLRRLDAYLSSKNAVCIL